MFTLGDILNNLNADDHVVVKLNRSTIELNKANSKEPLLSVLMEKTVDKFETKDGVTLVQIS